MADSFSIHDGSMQSEHSTPPTLLLALSSDADRKLIREAIPDYFKVTAVDGRIAGELFDLCIIDDTLLKENKEVLLRRKKGMAPVFLPVLLFSRDNIPLDRDSDIWDFVDDRLSMPMSDSILLSRITLLLQTRKFSVELERKNMQLAQKNDQLRIFEQAIHSTNAGVVITDAKQEDNPVIFCNNGFERLTGYSLEEVQGRNCRFLQNDDRKQTGVDQIRTMISDSEEGRARIRNYRKDGSMFWNELNIAPIRNDAGTVTHFVGIQNDVTRLIEIQRQLRQEKEFINRALEEKETLLQEVHHRVKNNLAVISGLLEIQAEEIIEPEMKNILRKSQMRIHSIAKVHELLYQQDDLNQINFGDYIKELTDITAGMYGHEKLDIRFHLDLEDVKLSIDQAVPCGMVINELMTNALKHAFPDTREGTIFVSMQEKDEQVQITFADDGTGIPEEVDIDQTQSLGTRLIHLLVFMPISATAGKTTPGFTSRFGKSGTRAPPGNRLFPLNNSYGSSRIFHSVF